MLDIKTETFLSVCRHMSFTRASEELNITQPAVSNHIKLLEEFYGVKLFAYKNRRLSLTPGGMYLKDTMEAMLHDTLKIKEYMQKENRPVKLRIGATMTIGEFYLPKRLSVFMNEFKGVDLSVTIADTRSLLAQLDLGKVDFALIEGYFSKEHYAFKLISKNSIVPVCAYDFSLTNVSKVEDLFCQRLLIREKGSGTREIFENYLRENGYGIESFLSCSDFNSPHLIKELLLSKAGISFLYKTVVEDCFFQKKLKEIKIPNFSLCHEYNAVWKKNSIFSPYYHKIIGNLTKNSV